MKKIKEHIKNGTFAPVYLLCGGEQYLKRLYRDKIKNAVISEADEMNLSTFEGKGIDELEVLRLADTMPFFAEHRLLVIENSGWFKGTGSMSEELKGLPDTTILLFVEDEVDKRSKLFKTVREIGYVCEMDGLDLPELKMWAASFFHNAGKKVTDATVTYLIESVGSEMDRLTMEMEKLISYVGDREVIMADDIDAICTELVTGKIFPMVDQVAAGNVKQAVRLYHDLLVVREKPMSVLYLLIRQLNLLLQVKEQYEKHIPAATIAKNIGVPPFAVNKYISQSKAFSGEKLLSAIDLGLSMEEQIKSGFMNEQIGVEILVVKFATM